MTDETIFTLCEGGDMDVYWECNCQPPQDHKVTKAIEKDRICRRCGKHIDALVDELNEDE